MNQDILKALDKVLDKERKEVFLSLGKLGMGVLGGGTAIAIQLPRRKSYDFDIFFEKRLPLGLQKKVESVFGSQVLRPVTKTHEFFDVILKPDIHINFASHPFLPLHPFISTESIKLFDLNDLASNKAYTVGRRATWRDYVDLFFLIKDKTDLGTILKETKKRFGGGFDEKLFLEQLVYFDDIKDFTVSFLDKQYKPYEIKKYFETKIKEYLKM